jgi:NNP family nitrate/nitrite transporter-like MFS transporter
MSEGIEPDPAGPRRRVLWLSTAAFTLLFAVWLMFGMLAVKFRGEFGLSDGQLYNLTLTAILAGSLLRFNFGVWADKFGGRKVMTLLLLLPVIPTLLVSQATEYWHLLVLAGLFGLAGNSFSVGIAWNAAWFPKEKQGLALGVFGAGNVGASVTKLFGPALIALVPAAGFFGGVIPGGWRFIPVVYAGLLLLMAAAVWFLAPRPDRTPAKSKSFAEVVRPLAKVKVWEYSLHYVVVFGAYVALSGLLPNYYVTNYGGELAARLGLNPDVPADKNAMIAWVGVFAAVCYIFPASLLRPLGGYLSDKLGARGVMAAVFWSMLAAGGVLTFFPASACGVHRRPVRTGRGHGDRQGERVQDDPRGVPERRGGGGRVGRPARGARRGAGTSVGGTAASGHRQPAGAVRRPTRSDGREHRLVPRGWADRGAESAAGARTGAGDGGRRVS